LDDEKNVETAIKSRLPPSIARSAVSIDPDLITKIIRTLGSRIAAARKNTKIAAEETPLDKADLFIVDYDLVKAKGEDYLTGETVAYLARCYSSCGVIVGLNQFYRRPTFDLTLKAPLDSFAELNLATDDLRNMGLWQDDGWSKYRPWAWPVFGNLVRLLQLRVQDVARAKPNTCVLDFLGFPASAIARLPTASLELLGSQKSKAETATLGDILTSPTLGLRGKEASHRKSDPTQDARIIAARLSVWLNYILAPQDVLVDAPHLSERCPSVVANTPTKRALDKTRRLLGRPAITEKALAPAAFKKNFWFDRDVWFWTEIERLRLTFEIREPWKRPPNSFVFCEDSSTFVKRKDAKSFQSDMLSPYRTRYVMRLPHVEYQPAHRLALS
jgi:hypothetical protein